MHVCSSVFHHYCASIRLSYIPACSHSGALWEFSSASVGMVGIPPPHMPHYPPGTFIIVVTLGARSGPGGPQTFPWRASPEGRALLRLVVFTMMNLRTKTVKSRAGLLMLRDGSGPPASMLQHCPVITLQYPWGRGSGPLMPEQRWTVGRRSYSPTPSEVLRLRFPLKINIHTSCSVFTVLDRKPALTSLTGWDWLGLVVRANWGVLCRCG